MSIPISLESVQVFQNTKEKPSEKDSSPEYTSPIFICFSVNEFYCMPLWIAIFSLLKVVDNNQQYDITILYVELSPSSQQKIYDLISEKPHVTVHFLDVNKYIRHERLFTSGHISIEAYLRGFIPKFFSSCDKVLYFDCDIIFHSDPKNLYTIQFEQSIAGCINFCNIQTQYYIKKYIKIDIFSYINSGVLLFNIEKCRENNFVERFFRTAYSGRKFLLHDQDIINIICSCDTYILDPRWNFQWHNLLNNTMNEFPQKMKEAYLKICKDHYITHFTSRLKPWNTQENFLSKEYNEIARIYIDRYGK